MTLVLTLVPLVLALALGIWGRMGGDGRAARDVVDSARALSDASGALRLEALRVSGSALSDFDGLFITSAAVESAHASLVSAVRSLRGFRVASSPGGGLSVEMRQGLRDVDAVVRTQLAAVELFKTGHSAVRNSRRFLPLAAAEVFNAAGREQNDSTAAVSDRVRDVVARLELFLAAPDAAQAQALRGAVDGLRSLSAGLPTQFHGSVVNFALHADAVILRQPDVFSALASTASEPVDSALAPLLAQARLLGDRALRIAQAIRSAWVFLAATVLSLWTAYVVVRLRSYRGLDVAVVGSPSAPARLPGAADAAEARLRWWAGCVSSMFAKSVSRATDRLVAWRESTAGAGPEAARVASDLHHLGETARRLAVVAFADEDDTPGDVELHELLRTLVEGRRGSHVRVVPSSVASVVHGAPGRVRAAVECAIDAVVAASEPHGAVVSVEGMSLVVRGAGGGRCDQATGIDAQFGPYAVAAGVAGTCGASVDADDGPVLTLHFAASG